LTFDDGPKPGSTDKVLDVLGRRGIKATFFLTGERVVASGGPRLVRRMVDEGHLVGNHGDTHVNLKDPHLAARSALAAYERIAPLVPADALRWFRFPYGQASRASMQAVEDLGHAVVGWHVDSADWCYASPKGGVGYCHPDTFKWVEDAERDSLPHNIISQASAFQGGITLMHDVHGYTADSLDNIITALAFAGFGFTWLNDDKTFPKLNQQAQQLRGDPAPVLLG